MTATELRNLTDERKPNAWMHICQHEADCDAEPGAVISAKSKEILLALGPHGAKWVEHYTIPLYAAPRPEAALEFVKSCAGLTVDQCHAAMAPAQGAEDGLTAPVCSNCGEPDESADAEIKRLRAEVAAKDAELARQYEAKTAAIQLWKDCGSDLAAARAELAAAQKGAARYRQALRAVFFLEHNEREWNSLEEAQEWARQECAAIDGAIAGSKGGT